MAKIRVSVVVTVLNEAKTIDRLIESLVNQTYKSHEIILVDGGSTDGTWEKLSKTQGIRAYRQIGNRSLGRNFGVSQASGKIIAFTDAGCVPKDNWLQELIKPFEDSRVKVVSGYYDAVTGNPFEKSLVPYVLVMPDQIPPEFFPSTRSMAIMKSDFFKSGGFDERFAHNEDYVFAHKLKNLGYNFVFSPKAIVSWIPRKDLKQAAWMFMRFAIGDAQAGIFRPKVKILALRYYIFFFLLFITPWTWLVVPCYLFWATIKNYRYVRHPLALFWLPVLQITADTMVLFGTLVGLLSR